MKTNKEKFLDLVSPDTSNTLEWAEEQESKRNAQRLSQIIAINILKRLSQLDWTQKDLADNMGLKSQQVNRWVRGKENFTLETLLKIGAALNIELVDINITPSEIDIPQKREFIETTYEKSSFQKSQTLDFKSRISEKERRYQLAYTY